MESVSISWHCVCRILYNIYISSWWLTHSLYAILFFNIRHKVSFQDITYVMGINTLKLIKYCQHLAYSKWHYQMQFSLKKKIVGVRLKIMQHCIAGGHGFTLNMWQTITPINDCSVQWHTYVIPGLNELYNKYLCININSLVPNLPIYLLYYRLNYNCFTVNLHCNTSKS